MSARLWLSALLLLIAILIGGRPAHASYSLLLDRDTGLFKIFYKTAPVGTATLVFWRGDWSWIGLKNEVELASDGRGLTMTSADKVQPLTITASAAASTATTLEWNFEIAERDATDLFGGLAFKLTSRELQGTKLSYRILPEGQGWELTAPGASSPMRVTFEPRLDEVVIEPTNENEVRAYFLKKNTIRDTGKIRMTVELPAEGRIEQDPRAKLAKPDEGWIAHAIAWNQSPIDLSFLNAPERPAGKRGFVQAEGERLVFEDGTPAAFWGTNLTAYAIFHTHRNAVPVQARRLSRLGYNLVRLHHHDSTWVDPNIFGRKHEYNGTLSPWAMDAIDWWIKCLKDEGIYVWLDMHTGRGFTQADHIRDFDEMALGKPRADGRGFNYLNPDVKARMLELQTAYLAHINPYTGTAHAKEPAIAAILITNENDVTHHFGHMFLPNGSLPKHGRIFMEMARDFATTHALDPDKTWRTWEHGPSKYFLNDLEHRFNAPMIASIRELGTRPPLATSSAWGEMTTAGLPSLSAGDIIDVHTYGKPDEVRLNPRYHGGYAAWIAGSASAGKPITVSEWNVEAFPAFDRAATLPYIAALARLQGWSAMMHYAYSQSNLSKQGGPDAYGAANDPALVAMMPAAALLYRKAHIAEAKETHLLDLAPRHLMETNISPKTSRAIRTGLERTKLRIAMPAMPELPWLVPSPRPAYATIADPDHDFTNGAESEICSDTGELCRNWSLGIFKADTPQTKIASGWLGGHTIDLGEVSLSLATPNATIAVQSLDEQPISASSRILISLAAQVVPARPGNLPFLSEPVTGTISITAPKALEAVAIAGDGARRTVPTTYTDGSYTLTLDASLATHWIMLEPPASETTGKKQRAGR